MNPAPQDLALLEALGFQKGGHYAYRILKRSGHVLLVLPDDQSAVRKGLGLYRPQRLPARLLASGIQNLPFGKYFLSPWTAAVAKESALGKIIGQTSSTLLAVLLGNPTQAERRAILLLEDERGQKIVAKVGVDSPASDQIKIESSFLAQYASRFSEIPELRGNWCDQNWQAFAIDYCEGQGAPDEETLAGILQSWCEKGDLVHAEKLKGWQEMREASASAKFNQACGELQLRASLRHGDLAPWNVLTAKDGSPMIIDWEFASIKSVPGWDLVHYLFQTMTLVERREASTAISEIRSKLINVPAFKALLEKWGWGGQIELLLKTYFYSMNDRIPNSRNLAKMIPPD